MNNHQQAALAAFQPVCRFAGTGAVAGAASSFFLGK